MSTAGRVRDQAASRVREQLAYIRGMYAHAYGFPLVMMDVTRQVMTAAPKAGEYSAPVNQFHRIRDFVDPDVKNVVRISRNSLWSTAFVDLDAEPVVFSHPATKGRYLVAQVMDSTSDCGRTAKPGGPWASKRPAPSARCDASLRPPPRSCSQMTCRVASNSGPMTPGLTRSGSANGAGPGVTQEPDHWPGVGR